MFFTVMREPLEIVKPDEVRILRKRPPLPPVPFPPPVSGAGAGLVVGAILGAALAPPRASEGDKGACMVIGSLLGAGLGALLETVSTPSFPAKK